MKIAIIGYYIDEMGENSTNCFSVMSMYLTKSLRKLGHIVYPYHILNGGVNIDQKVDIVISILFVNDAANIQQWKFKLDAKKIVSFLEIPTPDVDHAFMFNKTNYNTYHLNSKNITLLKFPWLGFETSNKEPKSIFLDHCWPDWLNNTSGQNIDKSNQISSWLINSGYKVYKHTRFPEDYSMLKNTEISIPVKPYQEYLKTIQPIDNYIITHSESFAYGIIDFVSCGSKILIHNECSLQKTIREIFNVKSFKNKEELIYLLDYNKYIKPDISNFHTYDQMAKIMEDHFKLWI